MQGSSFPVTGSLYINTEQLFRSLNLRHLSHGAETYECHYLSIFLSIYLSVYLSYLSYLSKHFVGKKRDRQTDKIDEIG